MMALDCRKSMLFQDMLKIAMRKRALQRSEPVHFLFPERFLIPSARIPVRVTKDAKNGAWFEDAHGIPQGSTFVNDMVEAFEKEHGIG
jgi:hypothetical protein